MSAPAEAPPAPPSIRQPRHETLADGVIFLLAVLVVQRMIGFGRGILFCRWLEPSEFGAWGMIYNFLLLASPLAVLGLPGSFGRYVEYYRQRGQLRLFLRRTLLTALIAAVLAIVLVTAGRSLFSRVIFGRPGLETLVLVAAGALAAVIVHHTLGSLLTAMRMSRVATSMQFMQTTGFALFGAALLLWWNAGAISIVVAYGLSAAVATAGAALWLVAEVRHLPRSAEAVPHRAFWGKLLRFSIWVWVANLTANLFAVVDRYMIVHHSGLDLKDAMAQVGYYQCSLIVPMLFVGIADLVAAMIMPHLSHDWESGRVAAVSQRLNMAVKLMAVLLLAGSVVMLLVAPLLFGVAFQDRYNAGLPVLPYALAYCAWFSILVVVQNYLWCAEKVKLGSLALGVGLAMNILLNLVLVPRFAMPGAVWGTTAANFVALALTFYLSYRAGMRIDRATLLVCLAPLAVAFGLVPALAALGIALVELVGGTRLLTAREKRQLAALAADYLQRCRAALGMRRPTSVGTSETGRS